MPLTVATWNVQNFAEPGRGDASWFARKLDFIVATLVSIDADLIALQEVLDERAAARVATALNQRNGAHIYRAFHGQPDRRQNRVAWVSRLPMVELESLTEWRLFATEPVQRLERVAGALVEVPEPVLPRPPLRARVRLADGTMVDLINVHLKSKLLTFPGGGFSTHDASLRVRVEALALRRRTAEATTVRARVDQLRAEGQRVIVLGDFNDGPQAATTQIVTGIDRAEDQRLFNLTAQIPSALRWSRKRDGQGELIDQMLVSQDLMPRAGTAELPAIHAKNDHVADVRGRPAVAQPSAIPDHALIYARFSALA